MELDKRFITVYQPSDFEYFDVLGKGAFGRVRRCKLKSNLISRTTTDTSDNSDINKVMEDLQNPEREGDLLKPDSWEKSSETQDNPATTDSQEDSSIKPL